MGWPRCASTRWALDTRSAGLEFARLSSTGAAFDEVDRQPQQVLLRWRNQLSCRSTDLGDTSTEQKFLATTGRQLRETLYGETQMMARFLFNGPIVFASGCCFAFWSVRAWWISWKDTVVGRPVLDCPVAAGANSLRRCVSDQKMEPTECGQAEDPLCPRNRNAGNRFHN